MILCCGDGHVVNVVGEGDVGGFRERKDDKKREEGVLDANLQSCRIIAFQHAYCNLRWPYITRPLFEPRSIVCMESVTVLHARSRLWLASHCVPNADHVQSCPNLGKINGCFPSTSVGTYQLNL